MEFRIADTFTDSLARLTGDEQKAVKTAGVRSPVETRLIPVCNPQARQDQGSPILVYPGEQRRQADRAQDRDEPAAVLRGHHDNANLWAERRKLEIHPRPARRSFRGSSGDGAGDHGSQICGGGGKTSLKPRLLPVSPRTNCSPTVSRRNGLAWCATPMKDTLLDWRITCRARLPKRCWILGHRRHPAGRQAGSRRSDPFAHPDAQRRFRVMTNQEELERGTRLPAGTKDGSFFHPAQRAFG